MPNQGTNSTNDLDGSTMTKSWWPMSGKTIFPDDIRSLGGRSVLNGDSRNPLAANQSYSLSRLAGILASSQSSLPFPNDYKIVICTTCPAQSITKCCECNQNFCDNCVKTHALGTKHAIAKCDSSPTEVKCFNAKHYGEKLLMFCHDCKMTVCRQCKLAHPNHQMSVSEEVARKALDLAKSWLQAGKREIGLLEEKIETIELVVKKLSIKDAENTKKVAGEAESRRWWVIGEERKLIDQLETLRFVKVSALQKKRQEALATLRALEHRFRQLCFEPPTNFIEHEIKRNERLLVLTKNIAQLKQQVQFFEDDIINFTQPTAPLNFFSNLGEVSSNAYPPACYAYGSGLRNAFVDQKAKFMVQLKDHLGNVPKFCRDDPTVSIKSQGCNFLNSHLESSGNGIYEFSYRPVVEGIHEISVFVNRVPIIQSPIRVVVTKTRNIKELGEAIRIISGVGEEDGQLQRPWGVCCDKDGRIIVADRTNDRVQVFNIEGKFLLKFGRKGVRIGEFNLPAGVATNSDNDIIVTDKDNQRVQVFTKNGIFKRTWGEKGPGPGQFCYPWGVACDSKSNVLVCDSRNHRLQLFNPNGELARIISADLESPRGVCFDSRDFVYVTDFNKHRIVVFNDNFVACQFMSGEGTKAGEVFRPQGVAVDKYDNLIVTDSRNNRIQIFKTQPNEFCHQFGSEGSKAGEMNTPTDVAVHPAGYIIVVDFKNTRLQVF